MNRLAFLYKKHYLTLIKLCIVLLFVDVIVDPTNKIFHLKYILFSAVFLIWLPALRNKSLSLPKTFSFIIGFVCLFMPLYAISIGLLNHFIHNTSMGEVVYFNSFFFFLLLPLVVLERIRLNKVFNQASLLVVLITAISYAVLVYKPNTFGLLYDYFVVDKNVAVYALRKFGDYTFLQMFYKTSPLLIFPLSYYLFKLLIQQDKKQLLLNILIIVAIGVTLFLSGTRANMLSLVLILLFYILFYAYKKSKPIFLIVAFIYLLMVFYGASLVSGVFLSRSETSNMVKIGHLLSYIEHFSDNIGVLLFGQGLGGTFYSSGIHSIVHVTELSYFEIVRIWGLPLSILFGGILLIPTYHELKNKRITPLFIAYIAYLFIAGTNPLLLSSTGMLVLVYVFSETYFSMHQNLKSPATR